MYFGTLLSSVCPGSCEQQGLAAGVLPSQRGASSRAASALPHSLPHGVCVSEWVEGSQAIHMQLMEHCNRPRHTQSQQISRDPSMVLVQSDVSESARWGWPPAILDYRVQHPTSFSGVCRIYSIYVFRFFSCSLNKSPAQMHLQCSV